MITELQKETERFPKELRLLIQLLTLTKEHYACVLQSEKEMLENIQWDLFTQLALHHRVFPIIYKKLKDLEDLFIPNHVKQILRREYEKNIFRMLQLSGETVIIAQIFAEQHIKTLFLKGPVLGTYLYGDISLRTSSDIDLLIPINELEHAEQILISQGYVKDDYIQTVLNDWKWRHHHITFFHPVKKIKVEIHWRLNPGPGKEPKFKQLWERKQEIFLSAMPIFILGNEDLFLFLVTHGSRHGWSRLRWLMDINYFLKADVDWNKVRKQLGIYYSKHIGGQALFLCSTLFNSKIDEHIEKITFTNRAEKLANDALFYIGQMVNLHSEPLPETIANYHKKHLFSLMSTNQKFLFIASFLFPYPEDADVLPLPKSFHFLYFPLRPFLWAWRWKRKHTVT